MNIKFSGFSLEDPIGRIPGVEKASNLWIAQESVRNGVRLEALDLFVYDTPGDPEAQDYTKLKLLLQEYIVDQLPSEEGYGWPDPIGEMVGKGMHEAIDTLSPEGLRKYYVRLRELGLVDKNDELEAEWTQKLGVDEIKPLNLDKLA